MSCDGDTDHRLAGLFEGVNLGVLTSVGRGLETQIGEHSIVAVDFRRRQLFAIDGNDSFALLAGRFGDQLFEPCAEI